MDFPGSNPTDLTAISTRVTALETTGRDFLTQTATPASADTVLANGAQLLALLHAATIAALTVTFPATPRDGQRFSIGSKSIVTVLTLNGGTILGGLTALTAGGGASWVYSSAATSWVRI